MVKDLINKINRPAMFKITNIAFENYIVEPPDDIKVYDTLTFLESDDFTIGLERYVEGGDSKDYNHILLRVNGVCVWHIENEEKKELEKLSKEEIEQFILDNEEKLLGAFLVEITKLVAEITSTYGEIPLITPPTFIKK